MDNLILYSVKVWSRIFTHFIDLFLFELMLFSELKLFWF